VKGLMPTSSWSTVPWTPTGGLLHRKTAGAAVLHRVTETRKCTGFLIIFSQEFVVS
jgi:hypothetical protein